MQVFGVLDGLSQLIDTAQDDIGLTLMDAQRPQRVCSKRKLSGIPGALRAPPFVNPVLAFANR
jgi:hypothetical protein